MFDKNMKPQKENKMKRKFDGPTQMGNFLDLFEAMQKYKKSIGEFYGHKKEYCLRLMRKKWHSNQCASQYILYTVGSIFFLSFWSK